MKHIFIGSSTEASRHAEQIRDLLYQQQEVEPLLWIRLFQPGMLTFEAIERAAQRVVGAVLIASPDDHSVIRDKAVKVPRTNVMIEFGYFTAILGRRNIALCRYDGVELATDLSGFTYIHMGPFLQNSAGPLLSGDALKQLNRWVQTLPEVAPGVPYGNVLHGYTGRWRVSNRFSIWRSMTINPPDYVHFEGWLDLHIAHESAGEGSLHGTLDVKLACCYSRVDFSANISSVRIDRDGIVQMSSAMHSRQVTVLEGTPPQRDGFQEAIRGPREASWRLRPGARKGTLRGTFNVGTGAQFTDRAQCLLDKAGA